MLQSCQSRFSHKLPQLPPEWGSQIRCPCWITGVTLKDASVADLTVIPLCTERINFPRLNIGLIKDDSWTDCSGSFKAGDQPTHGHCKSQPGNCGTCSTGPSCSYPGLPLLLSFPSIAAQLFQQQTIRDRIFSPLVKLIFFYLRWGCFCQR